MHILHITPHLGGGVGSVILAWLEKDKLCQHEVITLDYANEYAMEKLHEVGISLYSQPSVEIIDKKIEEAEIVLIHFWNHPLLYDLIVRHKMPFARIIFWAHISGLSAPNIITEKVANFPDIFVLTTPISKSLKCVENAPVIMSTSGIQRMLDLKHEQHDGFTVGYIGTVDYAKMHPHYIAASKKIEADHFLIVGGNDEVNIAKEADERFIFTGKVLDIRPYLAKMDVFGYMLNEKHFGTCEQVLQEAMAAGVPAVVMNNPCECSIIKDGITGLIANTEDEYIKLIIKLKKDKVLYEEIARNAQEYAKTNFSLEYMIKLWHSIFENILKKEKRQHVWAMSKDTVDSFELFCESVGASVAETFCCGSCTEIKSLLLEKQWQSSSKGTPKQYLQFLSGKKLTSFCELYCKL